MKQGRETAPRRRSATFYKQICARSMVLLWLLACCYWFFFVHSHSFYRVFYNGLRSAGNTHHDGHSHSFYRVFYNGLRSAGNTHHDGHHRVSKYIQNNSSTHGFGEDHQINHSGTPNVANLASEKLERSPDHRADSVIRRGSTRQQQYEDDSGTPGRTEDGDGQSHISPGKPSTCATVEEMGAASTGQTENASLRVRKMIRDHFAVYGAERVREYPPEQFCRQNFVFGRSSGAGFGNEMYRILSAAALSLLLNRSLIIGATRGELPFGNYIAYSNQSFTLNEIKLLWARNDCAGKHKRPLVMHIDDFQRPEHTSVLCEDWRKWQQPIIWFQGTTDTVAIQFFLKNRHPAMRAAASLLFGDPRMPSSRPNLFGELMKVIISPTHAVEEAVNWVLNGGPDPQIAVHMRMRANRSTRALHAALSCIKKSLLALSHKSARPRLVLVSDTPSIIEHMKQKLEEIVEVLHFDYMSYTRQNTSKIMSATYFQPSEIRAKDWGPMPRWVAFVDFFLASRATHSIISGAHRRVGTTYAQLIAAMAAAQKLDETAAFPLNFSFYSSFQSTLLVDGLANQVGWGHGWNRFGGQLSCHNQSDQCALTPLLPYGWWDGHWQSPIPLDIRRLKSYGVHLNITGKVSDEILQSFCESKKRSIKTETLQLPSCKKKKCV